MWCCFFRIIFFAKELVQKRLCLSEERPLLSGRTQTWHAEDLELRPCGPHTKGYRVAENVKGLCVRSRGGAASVNREHLPRWANDLIQCKAAPYSHICVPRCVMHFIWAKARSCIWKRGWWSLACVSFLSEFCEITSAAVVGW